jgi:hypothetical protein
VAEALPAVPRALVFFALMAPLGTPQPTASKISDDLRAVLDGPALKKRKTLQAISTQWRPRKRREPDKLPSDQ